MKYFLGFILKVMREMVRKVRIKKSHYLEGRYIKDVQVTGLQAAYLIKSKLEAPGAFLLGRFGSAELEAVARYYTIHNNLSLVQKIRLFLWDRLWDFWRPKIPEYFTNQLGYQAGFFPLEKYYIDRYCNLMIDDMKEIDILASWVRDERVFKDQLEHCTKIELVDLEPFFSDAPWTEALAGKKVLVISPFEKSIQSQYLKRDLLFKDPRILPKFELKTLKAVQSIVGTKTEFTNWFDALESMKKQIALIDFDIAILGCGAYGMPLCNYIKLLGKKAVYMGGVTQLLFGIKGNRWMQWEKYRNMFNENWIFPLAEETPVDKNQVQDGIVGGAYFAGHHN